MDLDQRRSLVLQQIAEAKEGEPADFALWRQKTEVVLRNTLGDANPLYVNFNDISYGLIAYSSNTPRSEWAKARRLGVQQAIAILQAAILEIELGGGAPQASSDSAQAGTKVFIVHGHDDARKHEAARLLRALTSNEPIVLHEQASEGRTIIEKFESYAADAAFTVVIATADDLGRSKASAEESSRARQNVIFELGFFFGALGRSRVALLYEDTIERPSDIDGIIRIPLDSAGGWKLSLARELSAAGLGINWEALR